MNDLIPQDYKPKSFWERPEGVTGQIFGVALIAGAGYLLYQALPYIITLLQNTIYAVLLGVAAVMIGFVVTDKRFWRLGKYLYMSLMRKITQMFVEIDPIGIMKNYVRELQGKLVNMNKRIAQLNGMIRSCKEEIAKNEKVKDSALKMVNEAKKNGKATVIALQSRKAGRMTDANLSYQDLLTKLELLYRVLIKYQDVSQFLIEDMQQEIDVKSRKKEMADAAHSAMKSAMSIIKGDPDSKELFNMANEYLAADYAMKIGEIEDFVRLSDSFMSSVDLQNGVYEAEAIKMLEDWEKNADSIVLGESKQLLIENNPSPALTGTNLKAAGAEPVRVAGQGVQWFNNDQDNTKN
jgi:phage shock protein A